MENNQEKTWEEIKLDSIDLLCHAREMATLIEIKKLAEEKQKELSVAGVSEFAMCEIKGRGDAFQEIIDYCLNKIAETTKKD